MEPRRTLLCVHPHPDDESIACGGVLARAAALGDRTVVVTCTGGEEGDNLAGIDLGDEDLAVHRRRELADALAQLDVEEHVQLGYRDSGMAGEPSNDHPDSFHAADLEEASLRLAAVVRRVRPDVVVSDDRHGTYGHPDHIKAHHVTVRAVALAADPQAPLEGDPHVVPKRYVHTLTRSRLAAVHRELTAAGLPSPFGDADVEDVASLPFGSDDAEVTTVVDVGAWLPRKRAALAAHRSQIGPDSFFLNTPEELATALFGTEEFVLEAGTPGAIPVEDDLFAGLTAIGPDPADAAAPAAGPVDRPLDGAPAAAKVGGDARPEDGAVDPADFRRVMSRFASGVTVLTAEVDGVPHGMTASAVASVSLDPPLVLVCIDREAVMADVVVAAGTFALTFLAADQQEISDRFADPERPTGAAQFDGVATTTAVTGSRLLAGGTGWVDARVWAVHDGGDHLIVVGEVLALDDQGGNRDPLLYVSSGYDRPAGDR